MEIGANLCAHSATKYLTLKKNFYVPYLLIHRYVTFLKNLQKVHSQHWVIGYLVRHSDKNELHELSDIL